MKRDSKLLIVTTLIAALAAGVPVVVARLRDKQTQAHNLHVRALLARPAGKATRELRQVLAACTEVRVWPQAEEWELPSAAAYALLTPAKDGPPAFTLRGAELQELIATLHAERGGVSKWRPPKPALTGGPMGVTAMEFSTGTNYVASIRARHGLIRWYTPQAHRGDAPLLPESKLYLEHIIRSRGY